MGRIGYKNENHPEKKRSEVFIWNVKRKDKISSFDAFTGIKKGFETLKTYRIGKKAFSIRGKRLNNKYAPAFIGMKEYDLMDKIIKKNLKS